jgi:hypothetical protein
MGSVKTSLHRPKFVHALTSGIQARQAAIDDQALRTEPEYRFRVMQMLLWLPSVDDKLSNVTNGVQSRKKHVMSPTVAHEDKHTLLLPS